MSNEEMDRKIAECLGDPKITDECEYCDGCGECGGESDAYECRKCGGSGKCEPRYIGPSYSNDLNAMHEAEKRIVDWVFWRIQLSHVVGIGYAPDLDICEDIKSFASSTAAQRAEAFLRTVGKWRDA